MLLACFLLPPLAAALLGSNQHKDWRHFYFLYAPFCLLAAGGLSWLAAALARRRPGPAGAYALVGLGLGLTLLQMAQLHPLQYIYFNFLVDRSAPEYLRTQYELDYWGLAARAGLASLLERHPGETLFVRPEPLPRTAVLQFLQRETLPAAARQRLLFAANRNADYELLLEPEPARPDLAFNAAYRRRLYNNTIIVLRPLDSSRMTASAVTAYRELYRQAVAGEPIIRADYNVYRHGRRLTFVRENCPPAAPDARLSGKLFPHRSETLPPALEKPDAYRIFSSLPVRLGEVCLAILRLPDYAQGDLVLMQHKAGPAGAAGPRWAALYSLSRPGLRELIARRRRQGPPPARPEDFAVFLDRESGRNRLLYAKTPCAQADYETPVTLHIYPMNLADLPARRRDDGYEVRDFLLPRYGVRLSGECLAVAPLPSYPIAAILTGQAGVWEKNLYPPADPETLRAAYAALSARQPAARAADFALYVQDNRLIYLRETCAAADTAAKFFLHLTPRDAAALPPERQAAGFANLDFDFARWGGPFDGKCLAAVPLPEYPIAALRTGQYVTGQGELWAAELAVGR